MFQQETQVLSIAREVTENDWHTKSSANPVQLEAIVKAEIDNGVDESLNSKLVRIILHDLKNSWTIVLGFLDVAKLEDIRYEPVHESTFEFYKQIRGMLDNYLGSALLAGVNDDVLRAEINVLQERLKCIERSVKYYDNKTGRDAYSMIQNALRNINEKLKELADINPGEDFVIDKEEFDVEELLRHARKGIEGLADKKRIRIRQDVRYDGRICSNQRVLTSLVENYLSNAIKYSEPGMEIMIRAYQKEDKVMIEVSDQGIGLSEEDIYKVFERKYMVPIDRESLERLKLLERDRKGIGLWLTKEIAEKLGGNVGVRSIKGKGSTFYLEMPIGIKDKGNTELGESDSVSAIINYAA
ncbi:HAMP domain-containing histidine kinase [Candidatus Woesearchaeota archaeon]|nr:HAMP domain-containing histidine kinase [Candidatus Woesearchaeota archaeon]